MHDAWWCQRAMILMTIMDDRWGAAVVAALLVVRPCGRRASSSYFLRPELLIEVDFLASIKQ